MREGMDGLWSHNTRAQFVVGQAPKMANVRGVNPLGVTLAGGGQKQHVVSSASFHAIARRLGQSVGIFLGS